MKKGRKIILLLLVLFLFTGCTTYLKDKNKKTITNPKTGQNITENIVCKPTDPDTIKIYVENGVDLNSLPACSCKNDKSYKVVKYTEGDYSEGVYSDTTYTTTAVKCSEFKVNSGKYENIWNSIFVKPLAWLIISIGELFNSFGIGLILTSILIRLVAYPLTNKTAMQSENMKKAQPELNRLEKKYEGKDKADQQVMMQKSQEMMAIYKKYGINPLSGCLFSFIQLPLFIAFLEAINRVPAIFEEKFLGLHLGTSPMVGIKGGNLLYIIVIILVGVSTYFSFKLNSGANAGSEAEKQTKTMMNAFLVMIIIMSVFMSSALGIYWMTSNVFTIVQNLLVKRRFTKC